jgi:hypothetical protein
MWKIPFDKMQRLTITRGYYLLRASGSRSFCSKPFYTLADVAKHNSATDCWMVINDKVYDVTSFIDEHPGGDVILEVIILQSATFLPDVLEFILCSVFQGAGREATKEFDGMCLCSELWRSNF